MDAPKSSPFNSFLGKLLFIAGTGISLSLLIIVFIVLQSGNKFIKGISSFFNPTITTEVDVSNLVVQKIKGVSELTTIEFVMDAIVPTSSKRKIGKLVFGKTNLLYIARGEVKAGIDLSKIDKEDVKTIDNGIEISLPSPSILDKKIDVNHSQVYDYDRGFLNLGPDVAPQLQTEAQRRTLSKVVKTACNQGILDQANERAKIVVTQLLETSGYENVEVKTTPADSCS